MDPGPLSWALSNFSVDGQTCNNTHTVFHTKRDQSTVEQMGYSPSQLKNKHWDNAHSAVLKEVWGKGVEYSTGAAIPQPLFASHIYARGETHRARICKYFYTKANIHYTYFGNCWLVILTIWERKIDTFRHELDK